MVKRRCRISLLNMPVYIMHDMELGNTSFMKHSIRLMENTPFKEYNRHIQTSMYQEVCSHLKEMLEIGALWHSIFHWLVCSY